MAYLARAIAVNVGVAAAMGNPSEPSRATRPTANFGDSASIYPPPVASAGLRGFGAPMLGLRRHLMMRDPD
jgi:hypothetical protein